MKKRLAATAALADRDAELGLGPNPFPPKHPRHEVWERNAIQCRIELGKYEKEHNMWVPRARPNYFATLYQAEQHQNRDDLDLALFDIKCKWMVESCVVDHPSAEAVIAAIQQVGSRWDRSEDLRHLFRGTIAGWSAKALERAEEREAVTSISENDHQAKACSAKRPDAAISGLKGKDRSAVSDRATGANHAAAIAYLERVNHESSDRFAFPDYVRVSGYHKAKRCPKEFWQWCRDDLPPTSVPASRFSATLELKLGEFRESALKWRGPFSNK